MIGLVLGLIFGGLGGAGLGIKFAQHVITEQANKEIAEYKSRWKSALKLLNAEGKITDKQLQEVTDPYQKKIVAVTKPRTDIAPNSAQKVFEKMSSADRADLEIARAVNGLKPLDDLVGMSSADKADVMMARIDNGTAPK